MRACLLALLLGVLPAACGVDTGPPLRASGIALVSPMPGRAATAAYMTLHNSSDRAVVLQRISSPSFGVVEMHESTITDGIARMQRLDSLTIAAKSSVQLATGGKHLMLREPQEALMPGSNISLHLHYDDGGVLILNAPVQTRYPDGAGEQKSVE